jgi:hypothetical protein
MRTFVVYKTIEVTETTKTVVTVKDDIDYDGIIDALLDADEEYMGEKAHEVSYKICDETGEKEIEFDDNDMPIMKEGK